MKIKHLIVIFLSSLLLFFLLAPLRGFANFQTSSLTGFICYFLLTAFLIKEDRESTRGWVILITILLGRWLIELPFRIRDFEATLVSLPDLMIQTLGIICGFLSRGLKSPYRYMTAFIGFTFAVFMFFQGHEYWYHRLNYGTFTGKIQYTLPVKFEAYDAQQNLITDGSFQHKVVLLDFWYTRCGACFEKFPQLQAAYDKYKNDPSVAIFAVDKPIEEDTPGQAFQVIKDEGYTFPVVIAMDEHLPEKFGVKYYPTTFVIDRSGKIVFRGDIAGAVKMVDELKESERSGLLTNFLVIR